MSLKRLFIQACSQYPSWPAMLNGAMEELCRMANIIEASDPAVVSRNFGATKFRALPGTPGNMLNRADFLDLLVRIARSQHHDNQPEPRNP